MLFFSYSKFHLLQTCLFLAEMLFTCFWYGIDIGMNAPQHSLHMSEIINRTAPYKPFPPPSKFFSTQLWGSHCQLIRIETGDELYLPKFGSWQKLSQKVLFLPIFTNQFADWESDIHSKSFKVFYAPFSAIKRINWTYVALKNVHVDKHKDSF